MEQEREESMKSPEEILKDNFKQAEQYIARQSPVSFAMTLQTLDNERRLGSVFERMEKSAFDKTVYRTGSFFSDVRAPVHLAYEIYAKLAEKQI